MDIFNRRHRPIRHITDLSISGGGAGDPGFGGGGFGGFGGGVNSGGSTSQGGGMSGGMSGPAGASEQANSAGPGSGYSSGGGYSGGGNDPFAGFDQENLIDTAYAPTPNRAQDQIGRTQAGIQGRVSPENTFDANPDVNPMSPGWGMDDLGEIGIRGFDTISGSAFHQTVAPVMNKIGGIAASIVAGMLGSLPGAMVAGPIGGMVTGNLVSRAMRSQVNPDGKSLGLLGLAPTAAGFLGGPLASIGARFGLEGLAGNLSGGSATSDGGLASQQGAGPGGNLNYGGGDGSFMNPAVAGGTQNMDPFASEETRSGYGSRSGSGGDGFHHPYFDKRWQNYAGAGRHPYMAGSTS